MTISIYSCGYFISGEALKEEHLPFKGGGAVEEKERLVQELRSVENQIRHMGGPAYGEDLVQDVYVKLLERLDTCKPSKSLLLHIASQKRIDYWRRQARRPQMSPLTEADEPISPCDDLLERLTRHEDTQLLLAAIERLKPIHRRAIGARLDSKSDQEAAKRLQIPLETFRSRLKAARRELREKQPEAPADAPG